MNKQLDVEKHYNSLAKNYDCYWIYSKEFVLFLTKKIIESLDINTEDNILDLGCGTGIYSKEIYYLSNINNITCVDPSKKCYLKFLM